MAPRKQDATTASTEPNFATSARLPVRIAAVAASIFFTEGLGKFWGWAPRPDQRKVRAAPPYTYCRRSRPSAQTKAEIASSLAVDDFASCWRNSSALRPSSVRSLIVSPKALITHFAPRLL